MGLCYLLPPFKQGDYQCSRSLAVNAVFILKAGYVGDSTELIPLLGRLIQKSQDWRLPCGTLEDSVSNEKSQESA